MAIFKSGLNSKSPALLKMSDIDAKNGFLCPTGRVLTMDGRVRKTNRTGSVPAFTSSITENLENLTLKKALFGR